MSPAVIERPRLRQRYDAEIRARSAEELGLDNVMEVPRLEKIVINIGVGKATQQQSLLESAVRDLQVIAGQRPVVTKARRSIAAFKLREGMSIGCMVTLRGDRMWEFFDRLISLSLSRASVTSEACRRSRSTAGATTPSASPSSSSFPEIDYDKVDSPSRHGHHDRDLRPHRCRRPGPARRLRVPVPT